MYCLKYGVLVLIGISSLFLLIFSILNKKPFRTLFINILFGLFTLSIINLTKKLTGIFIPINWYTVIGSSFYGLPFIIGFLMLNLIFI